MDAIFPGRTGIRRTRFNYISRQSKRDVIGKNGKGSSGKRTRHINIRYFFVQDRIAAGEVSVQYCPTSEMVADYFTKPLQGALFKKFRDIIMNIDPVMKSSQDRRSVLGIADASVSDDVAQSDDRQSDDRRVTEPTKNNERKADGLGTTG